MWQDARLLDLFGIPSPILQAPMTAHSTLEMAIAVSDAGGLGALAAAGLSPTELRDALTVFKASGAGELNVNFFAHSDKPQKDNRDAAWLKQLEPYYREFGIEPLTSLTEGLLPSFGSAQCEVIEDVAPRVVSFHFGLPNASLIDRIQNAGSKIVSSATTVQEARWLEDHGCDAVIAQGIEAGGHRGMFLTTNVGSQIGTLSLVPQVVDAVSVPVIGAGGIGDGRGIAAALALGASGVLIGTAFLKTPEAHLPPLFEEVVSAPHFTTVLTNTLSGRLSRCAANRLTSELGPISENAPQFPKGFEAIGALKKKAEAQDLPHFSSHYCGQGYVLTQSGTSRQLVLRFQEEALACLEQTRQLGPTEPKSFLA